LGEVTYRALDRDNLTLTLEPNPELAAQAHSRLAALLVEVRHLEGATAALEKLGAMPGGAAANAAGRLREVAALGRLRAGVDHYKLLGLPRTASAEEARVGALSGDQDSCCCCWAARGSGAGPAGSGTRSLLAVGAAAHHNVCDLQGPERGPRVIQGAK